MSLYVYRYIPFHISKEKFVLRKFILYAKFFAVSMEVFPKELSGMRNLTEFSAMTQLINQIYHKFVRDFR